MATENRLDRQHLISLIVAAHKVGDFLEAEKCARRLLVLDPNDQDGLSVLANSLHLQGASAAALPVMEKLLALYPMCGGYHNDYGAMLAGCDRWEEAEAAYRMAAVLDTQIVDAPFNLALALFKQQRFDEALKELDKLQRKTPALGEQYELKGEILQAMARPAEAANAFFDAVDHGICSASVLMRLAEVMPEVDKKSEGFGRLAQQLLGLDLQDATALFLLANVLREGGLLAEAVTRFKKAISLKPDFAEAYNNLGLTLEALGDARGAKAAFDQAVALDPNLSAAHTNIGNVNLKLGNLDNALVCFKRAVELAPSSAEGWTNLGQTYYRLQRLLEAEGAYQRALMVQPKCAEAELNLGILYLLQGDYARGWKHYEKRWEMPVVKAKRPVLPQPEWQGESLDNKSILVYIEQGMGDNIQFIRFLGELRKRWPSSRIYYWGVRPLFRLLEKYAEKYQIDLLPEVLPNGVPSADFKIGLLSLPRCLQIGLDNLPSEPKYLEAPADTVASWADRLASLSGKKVGVAWAGSETYLFHKFRVISLEELQHVFSVAGVSWVSLQKGKDSAQIAQSGLQDIVFNPMDEVDDYADTAAIIENLDLVISVDTSVAHLAGALGKPVWLLNRFDTDWRWLTERSDSPWYPTMRIFRQPSFGDWKQTVEAVKFALESFVAGEVAQLHREQDKALLANALLAKSDDVPARVTAPSLLRLNLGCGSRKIPGFLNVDCAEICNPDLVLNLENTPWPWADDSVVEIRLTHVLEHLGQRTEDFLAIIKEIYRVCCDGAHVEIVVPHPRHDTFLGDPTHVRPILPSTLDLFNRRLNSEWGKLNAANTPLGDILQVDFEIDSIVYKWDPEWQQKLDQGELSLAELHRASRQFNNVILQTAILWRVCKGRF